jgi:hypothetical protein
MKSSLGTDIIMFLSFLIAQILLSNLIDFGPMIFISIYPLYLLTRPKNINPAISMISAFIMGLIIDYFTGDILGINAAAATMIAFIQPYLLSIVLRKSLDEGPGRPGMNELGFSKFCFYIFLGILLHNTAIILLENFSIHLDKYSLIRLFLSLALNLMLAILIEFGIFYKNWR